MRKYNSYKPSGVNWIGDIPENWNSLKLKHEYKIQKGRIPKTISERDGEGLVPYLSMDVLRGSETSSFVNYDDGVFVKEGQTLILWDGSNSGEIIKVEKEGVLSSTMGVLNKIGNKLNEDFSFYQLKSHEPEIRNNTNGMGIPHVDGQYVRSLVLLTPPIQEQEQIVKYLDEKTSIIDKLISTKQRKVELLKEQRTTLINQVITKGLNPNVKMKDSGVEWIGEIPESWVKKKVKTISSIISKGTTPSTIGKEVSDVGEIRYLKSENIVDNSLSEYPQFFIDRETNELLKRSILIEGDILFVIAGASIGKTTILTKSFSPSNTNQAVSFIRLKENENNKFVWYWLISSKIQEQMWVVAVQSAQPNLSMENLGNFFIPYPSIKEQKEIVEYLDKNTKDIDDLVSMEQNKIELLKEYRQSLISEVITGKIKVV